MQEKAWVDFRAVKAQVSLKMALDRYGVNWLRKVGEELVGRCPIHKGDGKRTFHANVAKNAFNCFSGACKAHGNVLDFVAAMESCSVRDAAFRLAEWFGISAPAPPGAASEAGLADEKKPAKEGSGEKPAAEPAVINPPLAFQLRIDPEHEYGKERGISPETLAYFGAGFCLSRGTFAGRYILPLHDPLGQLVGYAGRSLDGREPKYLFPSSEKGFHKRYLLFNYHRTIKEVEKDQPVVLVEGFFDCMKVKQAGFPCLGLLGSSLSEPQEELIVSEFERVVLLFDGDDAGRNATAECLRRLARKLFVRLVELPEGRQPDMLSEPHLYELLGGL